MPGNWLKHGRWATQVKKQVSERLKSALIEWYESERPDSSKEPKRYVVCAGLAVLEHMRESFPLSEEDYLTPGNQVRTGGPFIASILAGHGETRLYAKEGARTTRRTRVSAEKLVNSLNSQRIVGQLSDEERNEVIDELQGWLVERVREYFDRKRIEVEIDIEKPTPAIMGDILQAASLRNLAGAVAQHLVGAKLSLRYPELEVENYSYTTADEQLQRPGDFLVGDTSFHVTVSPMPPVVERCRQNIRDGYRPC
jgi:hypothetical protein